MRTPGAHSASSPRAWAEVRPGATLAGKYAIERVLGQGGMGIVLAARDTATGAHVAIKAVQPGASDIDGGTERFLREAEAASTLTSENVARVLDVGTLSNGAPFMVMELLVGRDLKAELIERGALPVAEAVDVLLQVCAALIEAHGRGIVHRDIKPANLFLTRRPDGSLLVKVLDFGLAKIVGASISGEKQNLTVTGMVVGSPPYMSPEQLRSLKLADARSDIWGLGVVAFEMLSGERPFKGEAAAGLITSIIADEPTPLRELRPDVPEALEAIVHHCLRKDPKTRPQSVQEVAVALAPFGRDGSATGPRPRTPMEAFNPPRPPIGSGPALGSSPDLAAPRSDRSTLPVESRPTVPIPAPVAPPIARSPTGPQLAAPLAAPAMDDEASDTGDIAATTTRYSRKAALQRAQAAQSGPQTTTLSLGSSEVQPARPPPPRQPLFVLVAAVVILGGLVALAVATSNGSGDPAPASTAPTALTQPPPSATPTAFNEPVPSATPTAFNEPAPSATPTISSDSPPPFVTATSLPAASGEAPPAPSGAGAASSATARPGGTARPISTKPRQGGNTNDWR